MAKAQNIRAAKLAANLCGAFVFVILIAFHGVCSAQSQPDSTAIENASESATDSTFIADSLSVDATPEAKDTVKINVPVYEHGSISMIEDDFYQIIDKSDIVFLRYTDLTDIILDETCFMPLTLGEFGHFNHFSAFGGYPGGAAFTYNGRPMNDVEFGSYNPAIFSPEFADNFEILAGSEAVIRADNSTGIAVNLQEIRYDAKIPYTKLWFYEGGAEFMASDGIFSQNVAPNLNATFGYRRMKSDGFYENAGMDSWNVRGILRWNFSDYSSVSLVENFVNHYLDNNGGVDPEQTLEEDYFTPRRAEPVYSHLDDRLFRHDLTLTFSTFPFADTTNALQVKTFFTHSDWDINRDIELTPEASDSSYYFRRISSFYGASGEFEKTAYERVDITLGGEIVGERLEATDFNSAVDRMRIAAFARAEIRPIAGAILSGGARVKNVDGKRRLSLGARFAYDFGGQARAFVDLSRSERVSSPSESGAEKSEKHNLAIAEFSYRAGSTKFKLGAYARLIQNPIISEYVLNDRDRKYTTVSRNGDAIERFGGYAEMGRSFEVGTSILGLVEFARIHGRLKLISNMETQNGETTGRFPSIYADALFYAEFLANESVMRLGVEASALSSFEGASFAPQTRVYVPAGYESDLAHNGLNVFALMRLGDAYVRLQFENALSSGYYFSPIYPGRGRNFQLSFSWAFKN